MKTIFLHSKCGAAALFAAVNLTRRTTEDLPRLLAAIRRPGQSLIFADSELKVICFCSGRLEHIVQNLGFAVTRILAPGGALTIARIEEAPLCAFRISCYLHAPSYLRLLLSMDERRGREAADACVL